MKLTKLKKELKKQIKEKPLIENIYKELMNHLPERVFYKDTHFKYILINKTFADDLGVSPEEVVGKTDFDIFPGKIAKKYRKDDQSVIRTGEIKEFDDPYHPGKKKFVVRCIKIPLKDEDGKIKGILGIAYDITEKVLLIKKLQKTIKEFQQTFEEIIKAIMDIVETRDAYTSGHQRRTTKLACAIAKEMGCSRRQIENIRIASLIHDFGKIFIPMDILNKPAKLNNIEFNFVKMHPVSGYKLLNDIKMLSPIAKIVYQHHERINGNGYPEGKKDGEISLEARILGVADVIEAMTSYRPYRPAHSLEEALEEIEKNAGILYDKNVVKAVLKLFREKKFSLKE
ncbi:MAG TPA: PAS domain-containing protein [bacterium]|nr:PAS domain-containing protein [bacterium]HPP29365.1 PAS domain-containing protein [bacterium]